ncbi:zf-HC2 domain-containing protein [Halomonas sp. GXIMD04776]|uniref:zf-HC2 domain-containing protein n=1 Tax=Halomonas sp. GXIMD04776 TaxID=3415605 RepID=UPI003C83EDFA
MMFRLMMCREITKLMSQRLDAPLGTKDRLLLRMHIGMCGACRECSEQFELLHIAGEKYQELTLATDETNGPNRAPE